MNTGENSLWGTEAPGEFKFLGAQFWGSPDLPKFYLLFTPRTFTSHAQALVSKENSRLSLIKFRGN